MDQNHLELIRQKCIEANPNRTEGWDIDSGRSTGSGYLEHMPCRLADVLLAIGKKENEPKSIEERIVPKHYVNASGQIWEKKIGRQEVRLSTSSLFWNLLRDDLNEQSEDTIHLLAQLLK
jgi:hypothetical protein